MSSPKGQSGASATGICMHTNCTPSRLSGRQRVWGDRAGSAQGTVTAGGQCCLAWLLPAHDAVLQSHLLLSGRLRGMLRSSHMSTWSIGYLPHAVQPSTLYNSGLMKALCAHLGARLCLTLIITICAPHSRLWQGCLYLVLCIVCVLLSLSMWLLLRSPALCAGLLNWAHSRQCLQQSATALCKHPI